MRDPHLLLLSFLLLVGPIVAAIVWTRPSVHQRTKAKPTRRFLESFVVLGLPFTLVVFLVAAFSLARTCRAW